MIGKTITELSVGDAAEFAKTVSESDIYLYAGITGDLNPAHVNEEYAKGTFFKTRIAHGMLAAGFISTVMEILTEKNRLKLRTFCVNQDGTTVMDGEALVSPPKAPKQDG